MKIRLFTKNNELSESVRNELEEKLVINGYELDNKDDYELAISIGGDGKFISMIHACEFDTNKKYIGVNTGNLGYLTTVDKDDLNEFVKDLTTNSFNVDKLKFLSIKITSNDEYNNAVFKCLNEVSIRSTLYKTLYLSTFVNSNLLYKYSGDGLAVSTQVGSTAYNLSLGGPIIDNTVDAISIVPIAPINSLINKNIVNPFITSDKNKIIIKPDNKENSISLIIDGKVTPIKDLISIEIKVEGYINVLRDVEYNHITCLNNKIYK